MSYMMQLRKVLGSQPLIMTGVCVIVRNEQGEFLLQLRSDSLDWGTLGGALELGESMEEAAARELYEEAGLSAESYRFVKLLSGKEMYYRYPNGDEVYNVTAVYEARGVQGEPAIQDDEGLALRYYALPDIYKQLNPFSKVILTHAGYWQEGECHSE
ncbi:DNA mismatch repair protein MutT [Xylanibacillus composti]|uniref:DNA mismatch repair protein MutT n=1 Tax=Xylanibacillus composti TaxID=1572762 RepID=A0A8J4M343_9BACL|nr:NUDIX hydrolase [Xylanibacillus composti]GIQ69592.1 DNA mismatch repair protein MutT [Xylanibacillus composti]